MPNMRLTVKEALLDLLQLSRLETRPGCNRGEHRLQKSDSPHHHCCYMTVRCSVFEPGACSATNVRLSSHQRAQHWGYRKATCNLAHNPDRTVSLPPLSSGSSGFLLCRCGLVSTLPCSQLLPLSWDELSVRQPSEETWETVHGAFCWNNKERHTPPPALEPRLHGVRQGESAARAARQRHHPVLRGTGRVTQAGQGGTLV